MEFTLEQQKIIFNAVKNYQANNVGLISKKYQICDDILNKIFPLIKETYVEPGFEVEN